MVWAITLLAICEVAKEDAAAASKRAERQAERKREREREGDILAVAQKEGDNEIDVASAEKQKESSFARLWNMHSKWAVQALEDAVAYARENERRPIDSQTEQASEISKVFYGSLWDSLKGRGWKEEETERDTVKSTLKNCKKETREHNHREQRTDQLFRNSENSAISI